MEKLIAYKFVKHDIQPLENLKGSKVYDLRVKINNGEPLTREEKDWLTKECKDSIYGRNSVALMGWMFDFSDYLKEYVVELRYYGWESYWAADKTSLRKALYGKVGRIVEITEK